MEVKLPTIKEVHAKLDKEDPFTKREKSGLGKRNMAFIRNLQISRRMTKQEAIDFYAKSNLKSKEHLQKLAKEVRKDVENRYPKHAVFQVATTTKFEKPIAKTAKKRKLTATQKLKTWKKEEKSKMSNFFHSEKYKNTSTYQKVKSGHKKYPDATLFELRKGVNSKASQKYRANHGGTLEYSGRINAE